jgi:NAD(P)-dependent dehydrogenase (short-subunit alcohol dehydrogenase family)
MGQLEGRVALVTGASSGIGRAVAKAFAAEGAKLVVAARRAAALGSLAEEIGDAALAVPTDVTDEAAVAALFRQGIEHFGQIDILVNSAGAAAGAPPDELDFAKWRMVMAVNLDAVFLCSREALRHMKPRKRGRIITIGSISARMPRPNSAAYTASKFAVEGLTRSLALDARAHGIAVSVLHPGSTESEIWRGRQEEVRAREGMITGPDLARIAVLMAALPDDVNLLESVVLPLRQPFLGRG